MCVSVRVCVCVREGEPDSLCNKQQQADFRSRPGEGNILCVLQCHAVTKMSLHERAECQSSLDQESKGRMLEAVRL